jgi:hypothetical protein
MAVTRMSLSSIRQSIKSRNMVIPDPPLLADFLVIAGGGAGGQDQGGDRGCGGGGAGGYRCSVSGESSGGGALAEPSPALSYGTYTVTIGAGAVTRQAPEPD